MAIADDFGTGISSTDTTATFDLCNQWAPLVRALQSLEDAGVVLDAGDWTIAQGSGNLDIVTGTLDVGGAVTFDSTLDVAGIAGFTGDYVNVGDPGSEAGSVTVGGTAYTSHCKVTEIGGAVQAMLQLHRHSTTLGANMLLTRAKSDTSSHSAVEDNDSLASIYFAGNGGGANGYLLGAEIRAVVEGTPSNTAMPTELLFLTTPDASSTPTLALTLGQDQSAVFTSTVQADDSIFLAEAATATWVLGTSSGAFSLTDFGGNAALTIADGITGTAIAVAADEKVTFTGHVGFGATPTANNAVYIEPDVLTAFRMKRPSDNIIMAISGGAAKYAEFTFQEANTTIWAVGKDASGNFFIEDTQDSAATPLTIAATAGAGAIAVDASGYIGSATQARVAALQTGQTLGSGSAAAFLFGAESYDIGAWHSTTTDTDNFVTPVTGQYIISLLVQYDESTSSSPNTGRRQTILRVNAGAAAVRDETAVAAGDTYHNLTWIGNINASQVIDSTIFQSSGDDMTVIGRMSIHRLT